MRTIDRDHINSTKQLARTIDKLAKAAEGDDDARALSSKALRLQLLSINPETGTTWLECIVMALIAKAASGDVRALALVFERSDGKAATNQLDRDAVHKIALITQQLAPLDLRPRATSPASLTQAKSIVVSNLPEPESAEQFNDQTKGHPAEPPIPPTGHGA